MQMTSLKCTGTGSEYESCTILIADDEMADLIGDQRSLGSLQQHVNCKRWSSVQSTWNKIDQHNTVHQTANEVLDRTSQPAQRQEGSQEQDQYQGQREAEGQSQGRWPDAQSDLDSAPKMKSARVQATESLLMTQNPTGPWTWTTPPRTRTTTRT